MISLRTYQTWIKRSAELLDRDVPGWHKRIKLVSLSMSSEFNCICGQLGIGKKPNPDQKMKKRAFKIDTFGSALTLAYSISRGFFYPTETLIAGYNSFAGIDLQTRLWKHQINKRLKQEKSA